MPRAAAGQSQLSGMLWCLRSPRVSELCPVPFLLVFRKSQCCFINLHLLVNHPDNSLPLPSTVWLSSLISLLGLCHTKGGHECVLPESMVNPVLINKKIKRSKSYRGDVPVRKVTLDTINSGNSEDDLLWRIHLGIHCLGQAPGQGDSWDLSHGKSTAWSFDNQRLISVGNGTPQTMESAGASELSQLRQLGSSSVLNSLSKENSCNISSSCQKPPLKSATAALWAHQQIAAIKCTPACNKLNFYPFPNRKGPRISEAARRLGLYVSQ
ncbi:uncharacterized protein C9orf152 homolog isoform X1 [Cyanistes caeruleus]|uniref:uncharacterized protein C9orf152 homolog isoform X1 n=1 Tax=Cyanistes caeruleus TaxID=156563 RepID=UPI000CDA8F07|nr:uncharacterized protein C9orf152 homolog isoform X1 [Cyanistes caeruleus]